MVHAEETAREKENSGANKKPAMNHDPRRRLERLAGQLTVSWHWLKDHSGHRENDIAETLANRGIDELN